MNATQATQDPIGTSSQWRTSRRGARWPRGHAAAGVNAADPKLSTAPGRRDAGFVSIIVLGLLGALLLIFAFAYDGGSALTVRQRATDIAAQAARVGADAIVPTNGADTTPRIDPARAQAAAQNYLAAAGAQGSVTVTTAEVSVTVAITYHTRLLGMFFITSLTEHGQATAVPIPGLITPA